MCVCALEREREREREREKREREKVGAMFFFFFCDYSNWKRNLFGSFLKGKTDCVGIFLG